MAAAHENGIGSIDLCSTGIDLGNGERRFKDLSRAEPLHGAWAAEGEMRGAVERPSLQCDALCVDPGGLKRRDAPKAVENRRSDPVNQKHRPLKDAEL